MKKVLFYGITMMAMSSLLLSCSSSEDVLDLGTTKKMVNMVADPKPVQLTQAQRVFANDNNQFTLNFLKTVNETDKSGKSFIYSPLSITYVLGMVNDAATGQTEQELEQVLGFHRGGIQAVNDYCKNLIDNLPQVDNKVTLDIANAIFLNKRYTLKQQFEKDMKTYYDAKAEALDFSSPSTLGRINGWCKEKTKGMIPTILDAVNPDMMSYLLNAIYFKANWASEFDPKDTKEEQFQKENGSTTLPMMHQNVLIRYMENDIYSAVEIPYGNGMWSMCVMLPEEGKTTNDVIDYLAPTGRDKDETVVNMQYDVFTPLYSSRPYEVDLKLPRFETSSDTDDVQDNLIGLLNKMGIRLAFNPQQSEIPNMCEQPVYINMMRQKAKIKVNEEGSEAAAVTIAGVFTTSALQEPRKAVFHANRPFVYVIRESSSGVILFVGKFTGEV
ncbi:MAG: serpin family protein [Prevotella sp.]|nr:serpin family protein [Prevotella sp.]